MTAFTVGQIVRHDSGKAKVTFGPFEPIFGPPYYVIEFIDGPFAGKGIAVGADIIRPTRRRIAPRSSRTRSGGAPC